MTSTQPPVPPIDAAHEQPPIHQQPSAPARPELRRSGTDRMVGGVCGGLSDYTGIDTVLWRVGFVALTLAGGSGLVVYLLLWVLVPSAPLPADRPPGALDGLVGRLHDAIHGAMGSGRSTGPN